ncbi:MAG: ABC transporter permease subunit [Planctomycetaceae bacterium]|nr:ABC transporter permease subunit [Planctomycetaceae bacterium]
MIRQLASAISFPMLMKELLEQAQRRQTYILRTVKAVVLYFCLVFLLFDYFFRSGWNISNRLGVGKDFIEMMFTVIAWGIYLIMPAMTCGTIAGERERDTWQLLLVTRLGKRTILLEKYLGSLISSISFLLLSIPVMVVIYPLGGISAYRIFTAIWYLFLCMLLVGSIGLCCSAWSRTISGALIATYLVTVGWLMVPILTVMSVIGWRNYSQTIIHEFYQFWFPRINELANVPWTLFWEIKQPSRTWNPALEILYVSIPTFVQIAIFLSLAYWGISRPFQTGGASFWKQAFGLLDSLWISVNKNPLTRGKQLFQNRSDLPEFQPIAWRERSRSLLNSPVQRFRFGSGLIALFILTLLISIWNRAEEILIVLPIFFFTFAVLYFMVAGASLISRERSRQTLDILLATPISGRELLREKMAGINRWYWWIVCVLGASLGLCFMTVYNKPGVPEWILEMFLISIYFPPLAIWISVACGIVFKSQFRAVIASLMIISGWSLMGWGIGASELLTDIARMTTIHSVVYIGIFTGPFFILTAICFRGLQPLMDVYDYLIFTSCNAAFFLIVSRLIRRWCYRNIARCLGRLEADTSAIDERESQMTEAAA